MPAAINVPEHLIETVNRLVRTSRRMLNERGREPTAEELSRRLALPLERVHQLMVVAGLPIRFKAAAGR